jgi:hypothetical protein
MFAKQHVRWGWIKFMYIYTIIGAGGMGLGMLLIPELMQSILNWTVDEPVIYGISGSLFLALGILSLLGLFSPLKFTPVLLLQLCYKTVWFVAFVLPMLIGGKFPNYAVPIAVLFLSYIVGDLIAIPFGYLFSRHPVQESLPVSPR